MKKEPIKSRFRTPLEFSKTGLVYSGGATKAAAFHLGVSLALRDKGFSFVSGVADPIPPVNSMPYPRPKYHPFEIATYVGSSAGALIVTMLASGIPPEAIIHSFWKDWEIKSDNPIREIPQITYRDMLSVALPSPSQLWKSFQKSSLLSKTLESTLLKNIRIPGIFTTAGLAKYLRKHILPTEYFHELKPDLFIVGTQLDHSRKMIFGRFGTDKIFDAYSQYASSVKISDAVGASMTLPPIYAPYLIEHEGGKKRYYIDGEIRETLSTHVAKENGCDLLICSYTHQPYHYKEEIGSLNNYGIAAIVIQALYQSIEQKVYGAKKSHENKIAALETVREFFKEKKYPEEELEELILKLERKLDFKERLRYIFIHPEPKDRDMFFGDHFTLSAKSLQSVFAIGYKRAMTELRKYDFIPRAF